MPSLSESCVPDCCGNREAGIWAARTPNRERKSGTLVLALSPNCRVNLDKSFFLLRPHSTFPCLLSEDHGTKHCSHAGSVEAALYQAHGTGPREPPCGPGRVPIGIMHPALISSRTALRCPSRDHALHTTWGCQAGLTSDGPAEASFIPA